MLSFTLAGKNSYKDFGIYMTKRPIFPSPKRRVQYLQVPGRNGSVIYDEKVYEDASILVSCTAKGPDIQQRLNSIKAWLYENGENELVFSFEQDKKYLVQVVNSIDFTTILNQVATFPIVFNCKPFKYEVAPIRYSLIDTGVNVVNQGNVVSEPVIEVVGEADVTLRVGKQEVLLKGIAGSIILDSVLQDAYDSEGNNLNHQMMGEFIRFKTGDNHIEWVGNVSEIIIKPNWRWLV